VARWHRVHTVLPATHTFIHEWNEPFCMNFVSIHQMTSPEQDGAHLDQLTTHLSTPKGWEAESAHVGWPYGGWFTHISGHPSATGRAWDRESSPVKDRRSTTELRSQPVPTVVFIIIPDTAGQCSLLPFVGMIEWTWAVGNYWWWRIRRIPSYWRTYSPHWSVRPESAADWLWVCIHHVKRLIFDNGSAVMITS